MFTRPEVRRIVGAIQEAEMRTSGEIRIHVEMRPRTDALNQALDVFRRLGMDDTRDRNGVLIFLSPKDRAFAIVGDSGICEKVPPGFWDETRNLMQSHFREGRFLDGVLGGIQKAGESLASYFPRRPDDENELTDGVSRSGEK